MSHQGNKLDATIIILAGGFGTRLQSILKGLPKPLADINGTPFLQILLANWIEEGFTKFIFSLHFESNKIIKLVEKLKETILKDCEVEYVIEETPLGTGGAISYVVSKKELVEDFFVVNADTWIKSGYREMALANGNMLGVVSVEDVSRYGKVLINSNNIVINFEEKSNNFSSGIINAGVYKLSPSLFLKWDGKPYSLESDLFPFLIKSKSLKAFIMESNFIDIGVPEDYLKFCRLRDL
jgi:NDP-sugar pyrophosphorylase family protein